MTQEFQNDDGVGHATVKPSHWDCVREIVREGRSSPTETIRALLEFGSEQLGVAHGLMTRIRPGPGTLEICEHAGASLDALPTTQELSNAFCRWVIAEGDVLAVHDAEAEGYGGDPACEVHGLQCYIGEKVLVDVEFYGTTCFVSAHPRESAFSEPEVALVRLLARCIGRALSRRTSTDSTPSRDALLKDRALLRRVEQVAEVGGWAIDLDTKELAATREVYRIYEVPSETSSEIEEAIQFYAPEARPRLREALTRCIEDDISYDLELPFDAANGNRRWVRTRGERIADEDGTPVAVIGTLQDITEWCELRERLREHRNLLQSITQNVSEGIFRSRPEKGVFYANQALVDMFGYDTVEELRARDPEALYANPERREALLRAVEQRDEGCREVEFQRKDGSTFPGRVTGTVARDEKGDIAYIDGVITDLTNIKEQQRELRLFKKVVQQADEAVLVTEGAPLDPPGPRIEYANPGFTETTGYELEEIRGRSPRILHGENTDPAVLRRLRARLEAEGQFEGETINYRKDGTPYVNQWTVTPVQDENGAVTHWASIQRDVTERRRVWKKLLEVQSEERRRIDQEMHDRMGGLLTSIQMQVELARMNADGEDVESTLKEIEGLVDELAGATREISRQLSPQILQEHGLREALECLTDDTDGLNVDLQYKCNAEQAPTVASVVTETAYRVVQESLLNVSQHADTDAVDVVVRRTDDTLRVDVVDAGAGFDPDALGLNGVRDAVERLGGTFAVES
ncbi:MAG: hypothetical protein BRD55_07480, partial [Bacteroidetes bacterium SW_9_63_38]